MDQSKAVPSFIRCFLASDRGQQALLADAVQLAQANLSLGQIAKTWVPLPPIPEQRHITAVLDTVNEAIAKAEAVIAKLQQVRAGLLHDLLTHGLDEHGQLHDPIVHPEHFQDSSLGRIPYTWRVAQLREVADIASGVTLGRNLNGAGILELPYLRVANVQDGYLDLADVKTIKIFPGELDRFRLRRGDVLMNEGGDYDKLGRGTVWEDQIPVCLHQNHVFRVRCRPDVLNYYFLAAVSGSEIGKRYFLRSSKQSTNLASINSTQLNAFEIPLPSLAEQEAIVKILKAQDDQLTAETRGLVKLHALKSGLMADLLTGCIRVPESVSAVENQP
jgi:type I restriction enzyme, S subunit